MSNFLKEHLALKSVDSTCVPPEPLRPYMGAFMPPGFEHLEGPKRGVSFDYLGRRASQRESQPVKRFDVIGEAIQDVLKRYIEPTNG
jgi:hypothetical protein